MSGIVGSKFNHRGSGLVGSLGTDGQHLLSSGAGKKHIFETVAAAESYDDEPIKSDLTALAIREATNESSAAFNLPSSFIETFTDDTNLGTQTDGNRTSGYWATVVTGSLTNFVADNWDIGALGSMTAGDGTASHATSPDEDGMMATNASATTPITFPADTAFEITGTNSAASGRGAFMTLYKTSTEPSGSPSNVTADGWKFAAMQDREDAFSWQMGSTGYGNAMFGTGSDKTDFVSGDSDFYFDGTQWTVTRDFSGVFRMYQGTSSGTLILTSTSTGGQNFSNTSEYALAFGGTGGATGACSEASFQYTPSAGAINNATGTLIQSANAVTGTRTEVGGTMLYADEDGTATLGTDLSIFFSCDGGSNWTETDTYTAITPVYASGIKQVRLGKMTCTGGTDVRYKAVWANQSGGSKATRLHAIGINY